MSDKELKLEKIEASHTPGAAGEDTPGAAGKGRVQGRGKWRGCTCYSAAQNTDIARV
jgi:hypothetical protein